MHTIKKKKNYLLVTLEGNATYQVFKDAIEELLTRDDYSETNDIWNFNTKGEGTSALQTRLIELRSQAKTKQLELADEREREQELASILQANEEEAPDPAIRQLYLDEVVYPILEGLKLIKSYGLRVRSEEDVLKSSVFLKVEDY